MVAGRPVLSITSSCITLPAPLPDCCVNFCCADRVCDCGGICLHGHAGAGAAWRLPAAAVISCSAAALLHLPVQLPGRGHKHHFAGWFGLVEQWQLAFCVQQPAYRRG